MTVQTYLMVQADVVTNSLLWDGNPETWTPPADATMLPQETTPAMVWIPVVVDGKIVDNVLEQVIGAGQIGFTWNGTVLTTNAPKPPVTLPAPV